MFAALSVLAMAAVPAALSQVLFMEWNFTIGDGWDVSPRVHDLDLDRRDEIVAIASGDPPKVVCLTTEGSLNWQSDLQGSVGVGVALGDLDRDSKLEVVAASSDRLGSGLFAFETDGNPMWMLELQGRCTAAPVTVDLDWDGSDEVLVVDEGRGLLCVAGSTGKILWMVSKRLPSDNLIVVADLERTGKIDVLWFQNKTESVWIIDSRTHEIIRTLNGTFEQSYFGWPMIGDMDADGLLELIISTRENVLCIDPLSLSIKWTSDVPSRYAGAMGDLDGDGELEIIVPGNGLITFLESDGSIKYSTPVESPGWVGSVVLGDIDGDGFQEVLFPTHGTHILYGMDAVSGMIELSYASQLGGLFDGGSAAAIADGDWDGVVEVYAGTAHEPSSPFLALSSQEAGASGLEWPQYFHDWRATGNYETTIQTVPEVLSALAAIFLFIFLAKAR